MSQAKGGFSADVGMIRCFLIEEISQWSARQGQYVTTHASGHGGGTRVNALFRSSSFPQDKATKLLSSSKTISLSISESVNHQVLASSSARRDTHGAHCGGLF